MKIVKKHNENLIILNISATELQKPKIKERSGEYGIQWNEIIQFNAKLSREKSSTSKTG